MSDDQDGCEWASVSSGTGLLGLSRTKGHKMVVCLCVCVSVSVSVSVCVLHTACLGVIADKQAGFR